MRAQDIMTQYVISVAPDDTIEQALRKMLDERISGLPVIDKAGRLIGMVTEGDFLRRTETQTERRRPRWLEMLLGPGRIAADYVQSHGRKVSEIMTPDPATATEDTPLEDVVSTMEKRQVKRLPVLRGSKVVGIVSRRNLIHALAALSPAACPVGVDDQTIRDSILRTVENEKWAPAASVNVIVHNGVVDLWGAVMDDRERQALVVAAENTPGVKAVKNHIAWIEPMSGCVFEPEENQTPLPKAG
jgi:CBS domain-containing protein